jgi:hypothetical protein
VEEEALLCRNLKSEASMYNNLNDGGNKADDHHSHDVEQAEE